jgi:hypothetical protein
MTRTHTRSVLIVPVVVVFATSLRAESLADYPEHRDSPVRTTSTRLAGLIHDGVRFSSTFQALVERLSRSDLIVYVDADAYGPEGLDGRLTFVGAGPGARYVRIRVAFYPDSARQIAIIGHELRHAVEIADAPAVIDEASLGREYARIGSSHFGLVPRLKTFDTDAAIKTGERVYREMTTGAGD